MTNTLPPSPDHDDTPDDPTQLTDGEPMVNALLDWEIEIADSCRELVALVERLQRAVRELMILRKQGSGSDVTHAD